MTDPAASLEHLTFLEAPIALLVLKHRAIIRTNHAACTLFGYSAAEMEGQSSRMLYPSQTDFSLVGARAENWLTNHDSYEDQRFMRTASGEILWIRARGTTLTPDDPFAHTIWAYERATEHAEHSVHLTQREQEIATHVVNGRTCKEIALILGISHRTVEVHRARLMKKLGTRNTAELVSKIIIVS